MDNIATNVAIYEYVNDEVGNWIERDLHRAHFLAYFNCASGSGFYIVKEHKHHAITVGNLNDLLSDPCCNELRRLRHGTLKRMDNLFLLVHWKQRIAHDVHEQHVSHAKRGTSALCMFCEPTIPCICPLFLSRCRHLSNSQARPDLAEVRLFD